MVKQTFTPFFNIFSEIIHSVSLIFRDMWLEGCWSSSSVLFVSFFCFLFLSFFFLLKCVFSLGWVGGGVLRKYKKRHLRSQNGTVQTWLIWYPLKLFLAMINQSAFLTWCAYLFIYFPFFLAGICSHRPRLCSWTRVCWQGKKRWLVLVKYTRQTDTSQ